MVCFVNFPLSKKYFSLHRKSLSIRDILNMAEFVELHTLKTKILNTARAFSHAVELVIVDGVCLGIDIASEQEKQEIVADCREY